MTEMRQGSKRSVGSNAEKKLTIFLKKGADSMAYEIA
jgi:hypothetical protein